MYKKFIFLFISILKTCIIIIFISGCDSDDPISPTNQYRGRLVSVKFMESFSPVLISQALTEYDFDLAVVPKYQVDIYSITYETVDAHNNYTIASGAFFMPKGALNSPILSVQHGATAKRNAVASVDALNSMESIAVCSEGWVVCVPDYLGLGVSTILHPYLHAKSSANCVIDLLRACKEFCKINFISLSGKYFLAGYSEGGYVTFVAQKEIEQKYGLEIPLVAVAPMAGPYDLVTSSKDYFSQITYDYPAYLCFTVLSYNYIYYYNNLDRIFNIPYNTTVPQLFDGSKDTDEISAILPHTISSLFDTNFVKSFLNGSETELLSALQSNTWLDWTPKTPLKLYHGNADVTVPYKNAITAFNRLKSNGATNIELVTIEGGTHYTSVFPCLNAAYSWFKTLK
ncbi:MAG: hypothetical protein JXA68_08350 [Ignavibacteriales bacterium]|nr:hypothetical protein [Ignavibacteriales bacterium]